MIIFYELGEVFESFGQFLFLENLKKRCMGRKRPSTQMTSMKRRLHDEGSTHVELFDPKRRVERCLFPRPHPSRLFPFGHSTRVISYPSHGRSFSRMHERRRNGNGGRHLRAKWRRYVPRAHLSLWHKSRNHKHMACVCVCARAYLYMYMCFISCAESMYRYRETSVAWTSNPVEINTVTLPRRKINRFSFYHKISSY